MYGWNELPGALVRLLEADLSAGEFFEHLSDEQRGALLCGGGRVQAISLHQLGLQRAFGAGWARM